MDLPIAEVLARVNELPETCVVWQKWTCGYCGSRQTMEKENTFFAQGICEECEKTTDIVKCGYTVLFPALTKY